MAKHKWQSDSMNSISIFLTHGIIFQQFDENQIGANLWLNSLCFFNAPTNEEPHSQTGALSLSLWTTYLSILHILEHHSGGKKSCIFSGMVWSWIAGCTQTKNMREQILYIFMLVNVFCTDILKKRFCLWELDYPGVFFPNLPGVFFQISLDYFYESSRVFFWISWSVFSNH